MKKSGKYKFENKNIPFKCIKISSKLNHRILHISLGVFLLACTLVSQINSLTCPNGTWSCNDAIQCINSTLRCNNVIDCSDGSDEGATCNSTCSVNEFKCLTISQCIRREYLCDHDNDCDDGSDENPNCPYPSCLSNQFTCANKKCINMNFVCDGDDDCLDNSDEKFCASRNCPPNQLACNTTVKCVDVDKFCNGVTDCADGSDESPTCSSNKCPSLSCTYSCKSTPSGGVCTCPSGQIINPADNRTCIDFNECEMWDECDQICVNTVNSYNCQCKANYTLVSGGHCKHITSSTAKVVFSIGKKIFETNQEGQNLRVLLDNDDIDITSFDYNFNLNTFYFADEKNNKIYKGSYESVSQFRLVPFVSSNLLGPFSLAVDWITNKVYLAQKSISRIDVFSADGLNRTNLITSDIFAPTSIALDPVNSFLFFTDSGSMMSKLKGPKIERTLMDGSGRQPIVSSKLLEPVALTIDPIKKRIYWIDRKYDHLETCDYYGSKRHVIASGSQNLPHSVGVDIFENTIYYADTTKMAIMKLMRHTITTEANITYHYKLNGNSIKPKFVRIFHQTKQSNERTSPCSQNNSGCEHFCLLSHADNSPSANSFRCKCKIGYTLRRDLKTCQRIDEFLYMTQSSMIRSISLEDRVENEARFSILLPRIGSARAIESDCRNNLTFFYDPIRKAIFKNKFSDEDRQDVSSSIPFVSNNLMTVDSIAYDWIGKNLYFTNFGKITVVQAENPKNRRNIINQNQVYGLAVDPNSGFLFFSSIARPAKIFRSFLDGTNITVIAQRGLSLPYSISIDYQSKRVYWGDSHLNKIQYSDYDGNNLITLISSSLIMPSSIFVYKYNLYFIDFRLSTIYKTSKYFAVSPNPIRSNLNFLYQIKVFSLDSQPILVDNHPCMRQNGDCSHFCFAVPSTDPQYKVSRHCGCPYGFKLDTNMATCITNPDEPVVNQCAAPYFFKCNNERCVRRMDVCDGVNDCLDFSDELNCPTSTCSTNEFKCRNGTCIPLSKRCDSRFDCSDFSDEIQCPSLSCNRNQFRCNNGSCIPLSWKCDTDNDCGDSSDEANCTPGQCDPLTQFECLGQSGRCIGKSYVCDGSNDCINNHDEENCPPLVCPSDKFKCELDNICINQTKRCDGIYDCPSYTDEQNCRFTPTQRSCRENEFQCTQSRISFTNRISCIPRSWVCDGHTDCENGSDEPATCQPATCGRGYFKCNNSQCIPQIWTCDGDNDCGDNSDELLNCPALPFNCPAGQFKCSGTMNVCINQTQLCDNVKQCPEGDDEGGFCSLDDCSIQNGGCSHMCHRSPTGSVCFCPYGLETKNTTNYKKCEDINECQIETSCAQKCSNYVGGFTCACDPGYVRVSRQVCKAETRRYAKIYVTNGQSLLISNIEGTFIKAVRNSNTMRRITAFDFHNRTGRIYWADRSTKAIYSSLENGTNLIKLVGSGVALVESIAVDWIGENIYWADYVMQHIEVSKLDGKRRKILFNENVTNPRGLVLDPRLKSRYMFWSDWGKWPRIERANMDGTNRTAIITTKIFWPNGLAIDLIKERIYFADAHLDYIESCDYYGQKRVQILANDLLMHHPHGLSFFENNLFWVDRGHKQLTKMNRFDTSNKTFMVEVSPYALSVKIAHSLLQPYEENPCARSNCEHLCLLSRPNGFKCECQIGYKRDSTNDNRCNIDQSEFLMVLNDNIIGGIAIYANDTIQTDDSASASQESANDDDQSETDSETSQYSKLVRDSGFIWERLVPINDVSSGYDFTYDYTNQHVYWLQHNRSFSSINIQRVKFDGEDRQAFAAISNNEYFGSIYCLEFDPSSRNLFLGNTLQSRIEAVNVDNMQKTVVYAESQNETGIGYPSMLTINYLDSEIYWIDEGLELIPKKIGALKMDGSQTPRIIIDRDLNSPVSIFYHYRTRKIFWADSGRKKIESVSIDDTNDRSVVISDVESPSGFTIWDLDSNNYESDNNAVSILYYADQVQEQLVAFNLRTSEKRIIKNNVPNIIQLKLYQQPKSLPSINPCLVNNGGCHQICLPSKQSTSNGRICRCSNGLELQVRDNSCRPYQNFILFATNEDIRAMPFVDANEQINSHVEALPIIHGESLGKFDFDYKSRSILWIDDERVINALNLDFSWVSSPSMSQVSNFVKQKVLFELNSLNGKLMDLSVDWINNQLYYSYTDSPFNYIKVTKFPSVSSHLTIFSSKIDKPSVIAVNPKLRFLYWIDQSQFAKLERSFLDGSNRTVLISNDLSSPTDLFVDIKTGYVYWSDNTKDRIERCDFDGKNRVIIKSSNIPNTQAIFVLENFLYYADSRLKSLFSMNLTSNPNNTKDYQTTKLKKISDFGLKELLVFTDKSQPTNIDTPCSINYCDQICFALPSQSSPKCACGVGELDSNGRSCRVPKEYLIYAMESEIRSANLPKDNTDNSGGGVSDMPWKPVTGLSRSVGIDFDYRESKIIFTDIGDGKIASFIVGGENPPITDIIKKNVTTSANILRTSIVAKPEGIAYDWVSDTIFYTDNELNQVVSYKLSTGMRYVVGFSQSPRAIVVHPCKGYLFWTDVGSTPMIARTSLAGSNFIKIVTQDIKWPNGLTIDFDDEKLYWADAYYDKIESSNLDGNYRRVLSTAIHPFSITVHHHYIYWSDWQTNSIYRAEKYRGSNTIAIVQSLPQRPMDLHVWSEQRQKCSFNPCLIFNGGCSHICAVAPPGNRTECRCPIGMRFRLSNNDRTCSPIAAQRCNATQFTCLNGLCISKRFVCDGIRHCTDGSDESANYCAYHTCQLSQFKCRNGRCLPMPERCDRVDQCGDNSDEENCVYPTCNAETEFQCKNFKCIPIGNRCNGVIDCLDGASSDEVGCPPMNCTSPVYDVKCPNTNVCIMRRWLCDGDNDCGDSADENRLFCNSVPCTSSQFRCRDNRCIPFNWFCDGDRDCSGGEDEPANQCRSGNYTCPTDFFKCDSGRCIAKNFVCDGDRDCPDNSDEDEDRHNCMTRPCRDGEFRCESGVRGRPSTKCIRAGNVCDGFPHCLNSEDETNANCTKRECRANEFACQNGLCINANYKCDHDDDCGDSSDEPRNCTYPECTSSQFKCDNLRCIPASYKCNKRNDCFDNSDEKPELCQNRTCAAGQFQCQNGNCIPIEFACNERNDCLDNSDEYGCGVNECRSPILNRCDHICRDTLTSFRCECREGYKVVDRYRCIDIDECREKPSVCTQLCENRPGSYNCKCIEGYEKSSADPRLCKIAGPKIEANLIFTNNYYLRNISLITNNYNLIKDGFNSARGVAYDYNESLIYLLDGVGAKLYKLKMNTTLQSSSQLVSTEVLISDLSGDERGLAFDWITKKFYYLNSNKLTVCDQNGHYRRVLLNDSILQEATSIAIDPLAGYLFITDWKYPSYIGRMDLDGRNFLKIITDDIGTPIGITVDRISKRIWWTDTHLKRIEFSNYNGRSRFVVVESTLTAYPFAIAFFDGNIFWTDRANHSIFSADAFSGANKVTIRQGTIHSVFSLAVYHYSLQPSNANPCTLNNGGCSHLCLISVGGSNYSCACPNMFTLKSDKKTCEANCSQWHFKCGMPDERCIPYYWKCDGEKDCKDGSDELNCPARHCPAGQFQCNNSRCISFTQMCNGYDNCGDLSDEKSCIEGCPPGRFQCPNNRRCLPNSKVCDGRNDCGDLNASDESSCANFTCPAHKFRCNSGHCIDASYYCDEDFDCADHSDEPGFTCRNRPCPAGWTRCGNFSYKCIHNSQICDGHQDCPSGDDESLQKCPICHATGDFKCANNRCIMLSLRCNSVNDCGDNSDESPEVCSSLPRRQCSESEFKCANGRCIKGSWRCDHDNDCGDNSDELNCASFECAANQWKCRSGHCIPQSQHCNGIRNCRDFSDETSCPPRYPNGKHCLDTSFTCNNTFCINPNYVCEGDNDCGDGSDELLSLCSTYNCTESNHRFRCKNGNCIYSHNVCNGFNDCSDGSDEDYTANGPCKRKPVECQSDEFKCSASHTCIPIEFVCDQDLDCGENDESDEIGCYNNSTLDSVDYSLTCATNGSLICEHVCTDFNHTHGFVCSCHHGFKMVKLNVSSPDDSGDFATSAETATQQTTDTRRHTCIDINECESLNLNHCTQICENLKASYKCKCATNYIDSHGDGNICEATWKDDAVVLIAYGSEIRQLRQNISDYSYTTLIEDESYVLSMDVDPISRHLYWIDESTQEIKRSFIPNTKTALGHTQPLKTSLQNDELAIEFTALSVDWLNKNLYYAESTHSTIRVCRSDGRYSKTLITENAQSVYSLVVNPIIGMIFWIESGEQTSIMSASMNGENARVLVSDDLDSPTGLTIDYFMGNRIFWSDHKTGLVESIKPDGTDRVQISHRAMQEPFKIDTFENHIYWLAQDAGSVNKVDKFGRGAAIKLVEGLDLAEDIKLFHSFKVPNNLNNPCLSNNSCSHLCLLKPNNDFECACPDGSEFLESDIFTCDAALEDPLEKPLECKCFNCWCWYNDFGVHFKCHPGYKGDLCEINARAAADALIKNVTTFSMIGLPIIIVLLSIIAVFGYVSYKRKKNEPFFPSLPKWSDISTLTRSISRSSRSGDGGETSESNHDSNGRQSTTSFNSELNPIELEGSKFSPKSSTRSTSSLGFLNPTYIKQPTDLDMDSIKQDPILGDEAKNDKENEEESDGKFNIGSIFSSTFDKDKEKNKKFTFKKSNSKKKNPEKATTQQYDPSVKETFNDTVNLVESSKHDEE